MLERRLLDNAAPDTAATAIVERDTPPVAALVGPVFVGDPDPVPDVPSGSLDTPANGNGAMHEGGDGDRGSAPGKTRNRAARRERRAQRSARIETSGPADATPAAVATEGAGGPPDGGAVVADAASDEGNPAGKAQRIVRARLDPAAAPAADKRTARAFSRVDQHWQGAEQAIAPLDPQKMAIAPLVRYVNAVALQLNEAQQSIGRLEAERDAYRQQIIDLKAVPVDIDGDEPGTAVALADNDATNAGRLRRGRGKDPAETEAEAAAMAATLRRRRLLVGGVLLTIAFFAVYAYFSHMPNYIEGISKDSMGAIPVIGGYLQLFLVGWLLFRFVRVGGKGFRWLFPNDDAKSNNKRRR